MKCLDNKFKFGEHVSYAAEKCTKLIHSLSKTVKVSWELKNEALKTIYKRAILTLLLYGAPIWTEAFNFDYNKLKYIRVQRLMNIRIAKAFSTTSSEAFCIMAGTTPIIIKTEEVVKQYNIRKRKGCPRQVTERERTQELATPSRRRQNHRSYRIS